MRKVIWVGPEQLQYVDDRRMPPSRVGPGEALVRVTAAGVCSTDLHIIAGKVSFVPPPLVLGHEFAGQVELCGPGVTNVVAGDRVKCDSVAGCGSCGWCIRSASQFCSEGWEYGITRDGAWADWIVMPARNLYRLPDSIPDDVAAVLDPEVYGPLRRAGIKPGDSVAIFGPGFAGLVAVQLARTMGAGTVILCGTRPERLSAGMFLGADCVVNSSTRDPCEQILEHTSGRGVDVAFEAAGTSSAVVAALNSVRPQGKVILYGVHGRKMDDFPIDTIVLRDLIVYGALTDRVGWQEMIDLVADRKIDLARLITHRFSLECATDAYRLLRDRAEGAIKGVLQIAPPRVSDVPRRTCNATSAWRT